MEELVQGARDSFGLSEETNGGVLSCGTATKSEFGQVVGFVYEGD